MEPESFSQLLQQLVDALAYWADYLPCDRTISIQTYFPTSAEDAFGEVVYRTRLQVLARLGAQRRNYLAALVDAALDRAREKGHAFMTACSTVQPPAPDREFWEDLTLNGVLELVNDAMPEEVAAGPYGNVARTGIELNNALMNCDEVFAAIDVAIRQSDSRDDNQDSDYETANVDLAGQPLIQIDDAQDPVQPPDNDGYQRLFVPSNYLPSDLYTELGVDGRTLNAYAKAAGVETPGVGKRNHRYSQVDRMAIYLHVIKNVSDTKVVARARQMIAEIESKSKDRK